MESKNIIKADQFQEVTPEQVLPLVAEQIRKIAQKAGQAGRPSDTAHRARECLRFYKLGMKREIPREWNDLAKTLDPEYSEYLRLKKKFE